MCACSSNPAPPADTQSEADNRADTSISADSSGDFSPDDSIDQSSLWDLADTLMPDSGPPDAAPLDTDLSTDWDARAPDLEDSQNEQTDALVDSESLEQDDLLSDSSLQDASDIQPQPDQSDKEVTDGFTGDESENDSMEEDIPAPAPCPTDEDKVEPSASGVIYFDSDGTSDSLYFQSISSTYDHPMEDYTVRLLLEGNTILERKTCSNGMWSFGSLPEATGLLHLKHPEGMTPSTANAPVWLPLALEQGVATIVTLGDSIPSYGGMPYFPDRLAELLSPLGSVQSINVAVPGTATADWLPGTGLFENNARPVIPDADLVIISLGGNDLNYWVGYDGNLTMEEALELAAEFPVVMQQVRDNLDLIISEIQLVNPGADVVYIIYPNYSESTYWKDLAGDFIGLVGIGLSNELGKTRKHFSRPGITIVDMLGATPEIDLDSCLTDPLHLNSYGAQVWAEHIFLALGGVRIGAEPIGLVRNVGFTPIE